MLGCVLVLISTRNSVIGKLKLAALVFVFLWFAGGGLGHFVATDFFTSIVPPYVPYPRTMVYISAVFELLGALGLLFVTTRLWAGYGLFALTLAVSPANIYMWQHPALFPDMPEPLLTIRLVIQVFLLFCIWWSTRAPARPVT